VLGAVLVGCRSIGKRGAGNLMPVPGTWGTTEAMDGKIPMTPDGNGRLRDELRQLKDVERPKISREIGVARDHGDLSENAEYHAAKDRQGWIEARIKDIEDKLARAEVIDPSKLSGSKVAFGATVKLSNIETEEESVYRLVGADEANLNQGSISITSPLARALIGREVGDEVKVRMPAGERQFEILEVEYHR
jgi:transcription elongation factor GreA